MQAFPGPAFSPRIPMVVVGALRAGGSGKTSVTAALARLCQAEGWRVAILAYRIHGGASRRGGILQEVGSDADWRHSSDEALLLRAGGARVFVTRNRALAWRRLEAGEAGPFDIILSDDGFQDPRLAGAFRILLQAPGESPGLGSLLPAGPFRETGGNRRRADWILEGPYPGSNAPAAPVPSAGVAGAAGAAEASPLRGRFWRAQVFPAGCDRSGSWLVLCGLGDNGRFTRDLRACGVRPLALLAMPDHAAPSGRQLSAYARRFPGAGFLCTRKDAMKLDARTQERYSIHVVDEWVTLDSRLFPAIREYRAQFGVSAGAILVHYRR